MRVKFRSGLFLENNYNPDDNTPSIQFPPQEVIKPSIQFPSQDVIKERTACIFLQLQSEDTGQSGMESSQIRGRMQGEM